MSLVCSRCGKANEDENRYCSRCGLELSVRAPQEAETPELTCYRHPKELTNLRCGKCDRPICHRCVVMSPAGTRCRECSKSSIPIRPTAILYDLGIGFKRIFRGGPMTIYLAVLIISMLLGGVQTCRVMGSRPGPEIEQPVDGFDRQP